MGVKDSLGVFSYSRLRKEIKIQFSQHLQASKARSKDTGRGLKDRNFKSLSILITGLP